jgi:NAD-dependent SIR2 family protein deacetylase
VDPPDGLDALADLVASGGVVVLSGAGLSTESGIPDYRGSSPPRARPPAPVSWADFRDHEAARRRYWARSHVGWSRFRHVRPNRGHHVVAVLEQRGLVDAVVTQNVDGLHQQAGSRTVLDLHGRLDRVACLRCGETTARRRLHERLGEANRSWGPGAGASLPDGDVALDAAAVESFTLVGCERCGGALKPDVVFFGESIPAEHNRRADELVDRATSLVVLGSSLTVFSGRRLVLRGRRAGLPLAIVNRGPTRCDDAADVRVDGALGASLAALLHRLGTALDAPPIR